MSRFSLVVTIRLQPGKAEEFKPHVLINAKAAVRDEPDCHLFHVSQSEDDPDSFIIYEVYTDTAAHAFHREQPHYNKFSEATRHMVAERSVQRLNVINPGNVAGAA